MTATVKLYELAEARSILDEFLGETEGEVTPALVQLLDELQGKVEEKIERVALYVREQLATAAAIDEEAKRLAARAAAKKRAAEGLKAYLKTQMERLDVRTVDGLLCTVALQHNPPSVRGELSTDDLIALIGDADTKAFVTYVPESFALNRRAVLDAHKAGRVLPDGLAVEVNSHVRIR